MRPQDLTGISVKPPLGKARIFAIFLVLAAAIEAIALAGYAISTAAFPMVRSHFDQPIAHRVKIRSAKLHALSIARARSEERHEIGA